MITHSRDPEVVAERYDRIAELVHVGHSAPQIAEQLGVTVRTVERARKARGLSVPKPPPLTTEQLEWGRRLLADGASYREVAITLGRSLSNVSKRFRGLSLCTPRDGKDYHELIAALEKL